jgi:hypothetical protein
VSRPSFALTGTPSSLTTLSHFLILPLQSFPSSQAPRLPAQTFGTSLCPPPQFPTPHLPTIRTLHATGPTPCSLRRLLASRIRISLPLHFYSCLNARLHPQYPRPNPFSRPEVSFSLSLDLLRSPQHPQAWHRLHSSQPLSRCGRLGLVFFFSLFRIFFCLSCLARLCPPCFPYPRRCNQRVHGLPGPMDGRRPHGPLYHPVIQWLRVYIYILEVTHHGYIR